jgi:hypothetical protein
LVPPVQQFLHLAQVCSVASAAARADKTLSPADQDQQARRCADRAMEFLGRCRQAAKAVRWREIVKELREEADYAPLRDRPDWPRLIADE